MSDVATEKTEDLGLLEDWEAPALFAAHMPERTIRFRVKGAKEGSSVTLRKMDLDALTEFQECCEQGRYKDSIVAMLSGTIRSLEISYNDQHGNPQKATLPANDAAKKSFFKQMDPQLAMRLFAQCSKENGTDPNSGD